ncbi:hypothetical protein [Nonomuraea aridisoli]|nr:hypothetical protein [Nonomuraea aridisoli]
MGFVDVHVQALEECGRQSLRVRNMLDVDDAFVGGDSSRPGEARAAVFGDIEGAGALAAKVNAVWRSIEEDLGAGRNRLKNVHDALGEVAGNFRAAEGASGG